MVLKIVTTKDGLALKKNNNNTPDSNFCRNVIHSDPLGSLVTNPMKRV